MLKTVTSITGQFPATLFAGFLGLVVEIIFIVAWVLTIAGFGLMYNDKKMTQTGLIIVTLYLVRVPTYMSYGAPI
jgi:hypothetical protein